MTKTALIFGIGGQDGSYLADILLERGYHVHGMHRHTSHGNLSRVEQHLSNPAFTLHRGDLTDVSSLYRIISEVQPDLLFNEADQDNVGWSRSLPGLASRVTFAAVADLLEIVRQVVPRCRVFQPCSSTMFGTAPAPQNEDTPFNPQSPYACAKVAAYYLCRHYRQAHGMFVSTGILFNHTSPRQTEEYLLHKICAGVVRIAAGRQQTLALGNLDTAVDIGYARDYMACAVAALNADRPDDFVIGTGEPWTIRDMVQFALQRAGVDGKVEQHVTLDPTFYAPATITAADATKAREVLGFCPTRNARGMVQMLVEHYRGTL